MFTKFVQAMIGDHPPSLNRNRRVDIAGYRNGYLVIATVSGNEYVLSLLDDKLSLRSEKHPHPLELVQIGALTALRGLAQGTVEEGIICVHKPLRFITKDGKVGNTTDVLRVYAKRTPLCEAKSRLG